VGTKSVLIDPTCVLYKLKFDMIDALIKSDLISESYLDSRNKVAHVKITNRRQPKDKTKFNFYQNKRINLIFDNIKINKDFIGVDLVGGAHMTVVYFYPNIAMHKYRKLFCFIFRHKFGIFVFF
jgi:hypothetical protein